MKHIYKTLLILILIITIAIYFYTNRYEMHIVNAPDTNLRVIIINKWSGETLACCKMQGKRFPSDRWINLGIPKDISFSERFVPIPPTPTN